MGIGFPEKIYCDNGPHFRNQVIQSEIFSVQLRFHCSYHPQLAGLVERNNGTIKAKLCEAMEETGKGSVTSIQAVALSLHIQPNNIGLSPFETLYGRPFRAPLINKKGDDTGVTETIIDHVSKIIKNNSVMSTVSLSTDPAPTGGPIKPGDWVFVKVLRRKNWSAPRLEGPYQVLLSTPTAVHIVERILQILLEYYSNK